MIRVVVDTGVVVSAAFRDRVPEEIILSIAGNDDFDWIASPTIVNEYIDVLGREKFGLSPADLRDWRELFEECISVIEPEMILSFPRDQKDAIFLECSVAAEADYLITGDRDFVEARKLIQTTIISVSLFKKLVLGTMN